MISDIPLFTLFNFVIPDNQSYWEFSSFDVYLRLLKKGPVPMLAKYKLFDDSTILSSPATRITEVMYEDLARSYRFQPVDRTTSARVYDYFTDFSYLQSEEYQTYLSGKYGSDFTKTLLNAITE